MKLFTALKAFFTRSKAVKNPMMTTNQHIVKKPS